jgi:aldehyde dehydrogenase (NAD+)
MMNHSYDKIKLQAQFFAGGATRSLKARREQVLLLRKMLKENEQAILDALYADLKKHPLEAYSSEIGFMYAEITEVLDNLDAWAAREHVSTPFIHWPAYSYILREPLGQVLIIGTWNYPVMLCFAPALSAIAAGNSVVIKPSEFAPASSALVKKLAEQYFSPEWMIVTEGEGHVVIPELIQSHRFGHIFFTGSERVGKQIYRLAAEHLVPVTLELGGKSPCIVDKTAAVKVSAKRIAWSKYWNAGQTCVAPDYLLVHNDVADEFVKELIRAIHSFFGEKAEESSSYAAIISPRRLEQLEKLAKSAQSLTEIRINREQLTMSPVIQLNPPDDAAVMQEEIFGPILPIYTYNHEDELDEFFRAHSTPLAVYIFSRSSKFIRKIEERYAFGGGVVNGAMIHLANPKLPFGGIGSSGFGRYHGRYGFETFSHLKSMTRSSLWPDIPLRYAPFDRWFKLVRKLMS